MLGLASSSSLSGADSLWFAASGLGSAKRDWNEGGGRKLEPLAEASEAGYWGGGDRWPDAKASSGACRWWRSSTLTSSVKQTKSGSATASDSLSIAGDGWVGERLDGRESDEVVLVLVLTGRSRVTAVVFAGLLDMTVGYLCCARAALCLDTVQGEVPGDVWARP